VETIHRYLVLSGWIWHISEKEFVTATATLGASAAIAAAASGATALTAIAIGIVVAAAGLYAPAIAAKIRAERAEADLPYVLRSIASEVEAGIEFHTALRDAAHLSKTLGADISRALKLYSRGIPLDRALKSMGEGYASDIVRRAFLHIAILYQSGSEATALKKMADELITIHKAESKKFSSELTMFTLIFVAVAALVPALFAMYVMIGSTILDMEMSTGDVQMLFLGAFPIASGLSLAYIYTRIPAYMRR